MKNFFEKYDIEVKYEELDDFLLKLGANLATLNAKEINIMLVKMQNLEEKNLQGNFCIYYYN